LDSGGARDKVEELGRSGVKRGSLYGVHGDECDVVEEIDFHSLNGNIVEGCVYAVPD
jgi:hypothetical protein